MFLSRFLFADLFDYSWFAMTSLLDVAHFSALMTCLDLESTSVWCMSHSCITIARFLARRFPFRQLWIVGCGTCGFSSTESLTVASIVCASFIADLRVNPFSSDNNFCWMRSQTNLSLSIVSRLSPKLQYSAMERNLDKNVATDSPGCRICL